MTVSGMPKLSRGLRSGGGGRGWSGADEQIKHCNEGGEFQNISTYMSCADQVCVCQAMQAKIVFVAKCCEGSVDGRKTLYSPQRH